MKTIIVPTDFSKNAEAALDFAMELASLFEANVLLLHVIDLPPVIKSLYVSDSTFDNLYAEAKRKAEGKLVEIRTKYKDSKIQTLVLQGTVAGVLPEMEDQYDSLVIVMGTKGASGLKEFVMGSNTEKVVRNTKTPVLAIPRPAKISKIQKLLIPTSGREQHPRFFQIVRKLQEVLRVDVHILFINALHAFENEQKIKEELKGYAEKAGLTNCTIAVAKGISLEDGIANYVASNEVHIVAITTHGRHGVGHLIHGSTAENLVNHLDVPVLTFNLRTNRKK